MLYVKVNKRLVKNACQVLKCNIKCLLSLSDEGVFLLYIYGTIFARVYYKYKNGISGLKKQV